jgi:hypothetical protein
MTVPQAMRHHEVRLEIEGVPATTYSDARRNPTPRTVYYWHDLWRKQNFGPRNGDGVLQVFIYLLLFIILLHVCTSLTYDCLLN